MMTLDQEYAGGKRVSPLTMLYSAIQKLPAIIISIYVITGQNQKAEAFNLVIYLFLFLFAVPSIFISYFFFKFSVTPRHLSVKKGFISRYDRSIPLERIQNVNIIQNFLHRLLGIARVEIETAGDAGIEADLQFVTKHDAEYIKDLILRYKEDTSPITGTQSTRSASPENEIIYKISTLETVVYGLTRFRPLVLIFGFWIYSLLQQLYLSESIERSFSSFISRFTALDNFGKAVYIFVAFVIILISSWLLDLIISFAALYNFKLERIGGKLSTKFGLVTKRTIALPLKKIQSIQIGTNVVRKLLGYYSLNISTAGIGVKSSPTEIAVPLAKFDMTLMVANLLLPFTYPTEFTRSSIKSIWLRFFSNIIRLAVINVLIYRFYPDILFSLSFIPVILLHCYLKWYSRGYKIDDKNIFIKHGYLFPKTTIIPFMKLQTVHYSADFWQRSLGMASVHPDSASLPSLFDSTIEDIPLSVASDIFEDIAKKII